MGEPSGADAEWEKAKQKIRDDLLKQVAHIVTPAQLEDVTSGRKTKTKARCGAFIKQQPSGDAPVCRGCFLDLMQDERKAVLEAEVAST